MIEITREVVAYGIITAVVVLGGAGLTVFMRRRHRRRLRQRGIKRYGH